MNKTLHIFYTTKCSPQYRQHSFYSSTKISRVQYLQESFNSTISTAKFLQHMLCSTVYIEYSLYRTISTAMILQNSFKSIGSSAHVVLYLSYYTVCILFWNVYKIISIAQFLQKKFYKTVPKTVYILQSVQHSSTEHFLKQKSYTTVVTSNIVQHWFKGNITLNSFYRTEQLIEYRKVLTA